MGSPSLTTRSYYEILQLKNNYSDSIKKPKLLLVSGSNAFYGISCEIIEKEINLSCVNMARTAEFGLDYIFTSIARIAKKGDTIIFPLEYQLYISNSVPSELLVDYVFAYDPSYFNSADLATQIRFIGGISLLRVFQGIMAQGEPVKSGKFSPYRMNKNGDITDNNEKNITAYHQRLIANVKPMTLNEYVLSNYAEQSIEKFVNWCDEANINLIATWPTTVFFQDYKQPGSQAFFQSIENLYSRLNVPVLGKPEDFMYEKSRFFNSNYHLTDEARTENTHKIIQLIQPYL
jgi:hypothetical protein